LNHIRNQERNETGAIDSLVGRYYGEAVVFSLGGRRTARSQAYHDLEPGIAQIHRVGTTLTAVTEHSDDFSAKHFGLNIGFHIEFHVNTPVILKFSIKISSQTRPKKKPRSLSGAGFMSFIVVNPRARTCLG
jgi:hypothetical protein